ncbi:L-lactate permease [Paraburkholderia sp. MM5384-R2]|uniref:L-lactate permease n=1 Tax=Paraburkholderia sp. MM5384-R2 TaxID=2723097 RepID=UPI0016187F2A|nr:L-lactate permease [Paraburkholderia sp. MM5384-R2]MBB5497756.1 lactate permease [Paraburkholderia sp. MM5384-R2]
MFQQILNPTGNLFASWLLALVPVVILLVLLAVFKLSAWLSVLLGAIVTFILAVAVWGMPLSTGIRAYLYGSLTGIWAVDWITFWGVMLFNSLTLTGVFDHFRRWLTAQGTADVRAQTMLFAWAFGALLEGLVGFGYPWAFVAPILIGLGIPDLDAIRVAAIANNAPVSYGALGVPIIALAAVTGLPILALSASVAHIVVVLALLPPWVLIYLVSGRTGLRDGWPLAVVGSLGYIAGQYPVAVYLGPYLPDVTGSIVCFAALLVLLKFWRPKTVLGYGGKPVDAAAAALSNAPHGLSRAQVFRAWLPFIVLIVVVVLWTGPWSPLPKIVWFKFAVTAGSSIRQGAEVGAVFAFSPFIGGTAIFAAWLITTLLIGMKPAQYAEAFRRTWHQMWGALLVGVFIFGLAYIFNFSGMAASLAQGFSKIGVAFIVVAPILGWIGVALSGSNTSTNAMFGFFQVTVGRLLGFPTLLLPSLNSVGAEVGKPVAPQTASVGVSTSRFVRNEGEVIRHNMGWTFIMLLYLIIIGVGFYVFAPGLMTLAGGG